MRRMARNEQDSVLQSRIFTKHTIMCARDRTKHTISTFTELATHKENSSNAEYRQVYRMGE